LIPSAKLQSAFTNVHFQIQREEIEVLFTLFGVSVDRTFSNFAPSQKLSREKRDNQTKESLCISPHSVTGEVDRLAIETRDPIRAKIIRRHWRIGLAFKDVDMLTLSTEDFQELLSETEPGDGSVWQGWALQTHYLDSTSVSLLTPKGKHSLN
jgi:hypothetical protein